MGATGAGAGSEETGKGEIGDGGENSGGSTPSSHLFTRALLA